MQHVYFDHNATTSLDAEVLEAMLPWLTTQNGNPTSRHIYGRNARDAVELARSQVADACGAYPSQVVFTGNGTEANNFAIKGMANHVEFGQLLTSQIEHPCVTNPARSMQAYGYTHEQIPVNLQGEIDISRLKSQLKKPTSLVSVMIANNETGVIQDIAAIAEIARESGALMHTDAVQMLSKMPLDFDALNVHAMTISSHKVHGPQGAAALILDKRIDINPLLHGGGQEKGLRSGTENVAAIVGFGAACVQAKRRIEHTKTHVMALRNQFETGLAQLSNTVNMTIFSQQAKRLPNTTFFALEGIEGETLVMALDRKGYAVASGSACSSDSTEPSHVLMAMGIDHDLARGAIRVSFGADNTETEVAEFIHVLDSEITRLKQLTSIAA